MFNTGFPSVLRDNGGGGARIKGWLQKRQEKMTESRNTAGQHLTQDREAGYPVCLQPPNSAFSESIPLNLSPQLLLRNSR